MLVLLRLKMSGAESWLRLRSIRVPLATGRLVLCNAIRWSRVCSIRLSIHCYVPRMSNTVVRLRVRYIVKLVGSNVVRL